MTAFSVALVEESMRKSGLVWLAYASESRPRPAWHVWREGAAYLVSGEGEQDLPGFDGAERVVVTVPSKDTRARLLSWVAARRTLTPANAEWDEVTAALASGRLNAVEHATQAARWAANLDTVTVSELRPTGEVLNDPDSPSTDSHRAAPPATPATTLGRQPLMYGGLPRTSR